jgi:putative SOS response-associated peptidase YedK
MCGRFVRHQKPSIYSETFEVKSVPAGSSYNVAPSQDVVAVRMNGDEREGVLLSWGLVPSWSKDGKALSINARADTVASKPAFRSAFRKRRCLVLADGYFEWKTEGKVKRPFFFHLRDGQPFAFAGLWERWQGPDEPVETCALITTEANELTRQVHDRMPVILNPKTAALWLDAGVEDAQALQQLLRPYPAGGMAFHEVSRAVNNPRNNRPDLILPVAG